MAKSDFIQLRNIRVSFPHLYSKPIVQGEEGKCGATLLLDPKVAADQASIDSGVELPKRAILPFTPVAALTHGSACGARTTSTGNGSMLSWWQFNLPATTTRSTEDTCRRPWRWRGLIQLNLNPSISCRR